MAASIASLDPTAAFNSGIFIFPVSLMALQYKAYGKAGQALPVNAQAPAGKAPGILFALMANALASSSSVSVSA
jgi:hypothetical protein